MRYVSLALLCACLLGLAACGDDDDKGPSIFDPGGMKNYADDMKKLSEEMQGGKIELTDELMEEYVKIATEIKNDADKGKAGQMAILSKYGWGYGRWMSVVAKVTMGMMQTGLASSRPQIEESIEQVKKQIAGLDGKANAAPQIKMYESQLEMLKRQLESIPADDSLAAKNRAVLERWKAKIDAIGD